jgi:hypothetical protein
MFCLLNVVKLKIVHKKTASSLFLADFNNLHTILSRIVSISFFYSKLKSDHYCSIGIVFKVQNQKLAPVRPFCWISKIHTSFWQKLSHKSWPVFEIKNQTIEAQTATILLCVIEFPHQNWAGWMTHHVIFLGGGCIFTAFHVSIHQKALYRRPWQLWPRPEGYPGKSLNCIKTRAYLANKSYPHIPKINAESYNFLQFLSAFMLWAIRLWKP